MLQVLCLSEIKKAPLDRCWIGLFAYIRYIYIHRYIYGSIIACQVLAVNRVLYAFLKIILYVVYGNLVADPGAGRKKILKKIFREDPLSWPTWSFPALLGLRLRVF